MIYIHFSDVDDWLEDLARTVAEQGIGDQAVTWVRLSVRWRYDAQLPIRHVSVTASYRTGDEVVLCSHSVGEAWSPDDSRSQETKARANELLAKVKAELQRLRLPKARGGAVLET